MKFKALAVIFLLAVSALPLAFAGTFKSTEGRFSADFLGTPTVDTRVVKTAKNEDVTITNFFAMRDDKTLGENIDYTDFPQPLTTQQLIDTAKAAFSNMTLDGVGRTESQGRTWILAAGHDDNLLYFYATTCVGTRLYEVTIAVPMKDEEKARAGENEAEAFLGSVVITEK